MFRVEINGRVARLDEAVSESAAVLAAAKLPLFSGLGGDVAAIRAAISLAERLRGVVDHCNSAESLRNLAVLQRSGWMTVSPGEVARSCDLLLRVGQPGADIRLPPSARTREISPADLPALRALIRGYSAARLNVSEAKLLATAEALQQATFGVATWSAAQLNEAEIEMLMGLVRDLNEKSRFSTLPIAPGDNAFGANLVSGWMTGFAMRTGFGRGYPEFDPWAFDALRLAETGEADAVLWLSAYRPAAPCWKAILPMIAVVAAGTKFKKPPRVLFEVGRPGHDHDAVEYRFEIGALAPVSAASPSEAPQAAMILDKIAGALP